ISVSYPNGPRCTPSYDAGKLYTLGAVGDLICFDAKTGKVQWSLDLKKEYNVKAPLWGFAAHPLIDGNRLICLVGGEGSIAVAFDKNNGKEIWKALSAEEPGYSPPMIYEAGGTRQLIIWHPEAIAGLDPATGRTYWSQPFRVQAGIAIATPRFVDDRLFVTCFYNGSLMLKLDRKTPAAQVL